MSEQSDLSEQGGVSESVARAWKELPEVQEKAKKFGLDVDKVTLGYVVDHITGDDVNAFGPLLFSYPQSRPDEIQAGKDFILARLDWEVGLAVLPQNISERLKEVRQEMEKSQWTTEEGFRNAYDLWKTRAKEYVEGYPGIIEARRVYRELEGRVKKRPQR